MTDCEVFVGAHGFNRNGFPHDGRKPVTFNGKELAVYEYVGHDGNSGGKETLFRLDDERLVVHSHEWNRWQGSGCSDILVAIEESDLLYGARFADLGFEAKMWTEIPLEDALDKACPEGSTELCRSLAEGSDDE